MRSPKHWIRATYQDGRFTVWFFNRRQLERYRRQIASCGARAIREGKRK